MAAFDTPWVDCMADEPSTSHHGRGVSSDLHSYPPITDPNPPTIASFSPPSSSPASRSSFQVHQKSPLLVATPPQVTRALSQIYPYLKVANQGAGLLTWTTKDPWESFLVVAGFWAVVLYAGVLLHWGGNILAVACLALGMFLRRYRDAQTSTTLDEILETTTTLTTRLNIFFEPFTSLTLFLSTTETPTTATTRPALTTLFVRMFFVTPLWLLLAIYPFHLITARRVVLAVGTLVLTWHSRPAKVSRTILWRSTMIRYTCEKLTGINLTQAPPPPALPPRRRPALPETTIATTNTITNTTITNTNTNTTTTTTPSSSSSSSSANTRINKDTKSTPLIASTTGASPGVKFTFAIYENQRRWLGVGWTSSLFTYERAAWTDEHLHPCPAPEEFTLPETPDDAGVVWRWVGSEEWHVEGASTTTTTATSTSSAVVDGKHHKTQEIKDKLGGSGEEGGGWVYYDNKWTDGRRGVDGWGKYTRRRKWVRNAELVEVVESEGSVESGMQTPLGEDEGGEAGDEMKGPEIVLEDVDAFVGGKKRILGLGRF